jgi:ribonuclease P protein component
MQLTTIRRRAHFLRVRGGARFSCATFALEARPRPPGEPDQGARFGFTVTKKLGNAVVRNRIKRRLRDAVRHSASPYSLPDHDYVLIARGAALRRSFADLTSDLQTALQRVHAKGPPRFPRAAKPSDPASTASMPTRSEPANADAQAVLPNPAHPPRTERHGR